MILSFVMGALSVHLAPQHILNALKVSTAHKAARKLQLALVANLVQLGQLNVLCAVKGTIAHHDPLLKLFVLEDITHTLKQVIVLCVPLLNFAQKARSQPSSAQQGHTVEPARVSVVFAPRAINVLQALFRQLFVPVAFIVLHRQVIVKYAQQAHFVSRDLLPRFSVSRELTLKASQAFVKYALKVTSVWRALHHLSFAQPVNLVDRAKVSAVFALKVFIVLKAPHFQLSVKRVHTQRLK